MGRIFVFLACLVSSVWSRALRTCLYSIFWDPLSKLMEGQLHRGLSAISLYANERLTSDSMETPSWTTPHDCICSLVGHPVRNTPDGLLAASAPSTSLSSGAEDVGGGWRDRINTGVVDGQVPQVEIRFLLLFSHQTPFLSSAEYVIISVLLSN